MERENLEQRELLEQYLLGLTNREQTAHVEELLENDPAAAAELAELKGKMSDYLAEQGLGPERSDERRSLQDFHDLDHEMITAMTRRNHGLVIWRLALSAACLLLLFATGYLFRQNQNYRQEVDREKALHAQDDASAQRQILALEDKEYDWDSLHTQTFASSNGDVFVHYLSDGEEVTFLDLSHLAPLPKDEAYHLQANSKFGKAEHDVLPDSSYSALIAVEEGTDHIKIWRGRVTSVLPRDSTHASLIADFPLARAGRPRD